MFGDLGCCHRHVQQKKSGSVMMNNGLLQKKTVQPISECEMGTSYETI